MDDLPVELVQRIGRFCNRKQDLSSFAATCTLALVSVRPILFESISIITTMALQYDMMLSLSESNLAILVREIYFYFTPSCDLSQWPHLLVLFTHMRRILLSTSTRIGNGRRLQGDEVHGFHNLITGLSSLSTIRSLHVYGGDMPDVQFHSLNTIHLCDCSFSQSDTSNPPSQRWLPSTLSLGVCEFPCTLFPGVFDWTCMRQFIGTQNVQTLVIDWPEMRPVFDCDFPNIKSLVLQRAYPSLSTLSSNSCILVKDYVEDTIKPTTGIPKQLKNYSVCWRVTQPKFGDIVHAFPSLLQGVLTDNFSLKLIFEEMLLEVFFLDGAPFLRNSILSLLPSANAVIFGISVSYPTRHQVLVWNPRWKSYSSIHALIDEMERQLYAHLPLEGGGKVSGGIFWEFSLRHHSWDSPGRNSWDFLPPQEDRHLYAFPSPSRNHFQAQQRVNS
jgi:hypothetical protein